MGTVRGYTIAGHWRYLEHDWIARPGTFIYEPAGEAHTLVITDDSPELALIFFAVEGGLIYLDKPVGGACAAYEDGNRWNCVAGYREAGKTRATWTLNWIAAVWPPHRVLRGSKSTL